MMEDSCGPSKRKKSSADDDTDLPASSNNNAEESNGNDQFVHLPHLVLEKIFKYLHFKDLLKCSLVTKFWNHEARRLLREKHKCALTVDIDQKSAKEIIEFKATLGELPLPYGSLSIKTQNTLPLVMWSKEVERAQMALKDIILRAGPFEVVQLDVNCGSNSKLSVEGSMIWSVMTVIQKTVKVLMIKNLDGYDLLMNAKTFPELKTLEINLKAAVQKRDIKSIQNFVRFSEKLESVGRMSPKLLQVLKKLPPARKLALVKEFSCVDMDMSQEVAAFAALEPKLEKLFIPRNPRYRSYQLDPTNSISISLLLSSQASVIELQAPYEMLLEVRREKPMASFMNLRYLTVDLPLGTGREELDRSGIIIALCPNLEKLEINTKASHLTSRHRNDGFSSLRETFELFRRSRYAIP